MTYLRSNKAFIYPQPVMLVCVLSAHKHWYCTRERYLMPFIDARARPTAGFIRLVIKMQYLLALKNNLVNIVSAELILCLSKKTYYLSKFRNEWCYLFDKGRCVRDQYNTRSQIPGTASFYCFLYTLYS